MLVIEGPDMVGKTTLAKAIMDRLGMKPTRYQHFGRLPENWDYCRDYLKRTDRWMVTDRWWQSEVIYGSVIRGHTNISQRQIDIVHGACKAAGGLVVLIWPETPNDYERIMNANWTKREMFSPDQNIRIDMAYSARQDELRPDIVIPLHWHPIKMTWPAETSFVDMIATEYAKRQELIT